MIESMSKPAEEANLAEQSGAAMRRALQRDPIEG